MVAAIEAAPASASALGMIGAALDAAAVRFEEAREFAGPRYRIIASSHELQERELIKSASLPAAMARALRARGSGGGAALAARTGTGIVHVSFEQWVDDPASPADDLPPSSALRDFRTGAAIRIAKRVLALAAALPHNNHTGAPATRSPTAYDSQ